MAQNLTALAAAFNAISPVPATLDAAVPTLNAQTTTQAIDVPVQAIAAYLGANMKMASFLAWAASPPSGASAASLAAADELAFAFQHSGLVPSFAMSNPNVATQMEAALAALVDPGTNIAAPITSADQTAILALASRTVSVWPEPVQVAHLQMAQRAGLIAAGIPAWPGQVVA